MNLEPELIAEGLGWAEGPTVLPDGRVCFVETYRSQVSVWERGKGVSRYAYTAGGPNSCVLGATGEMYVCQNGGTTGPWRAEEMVTPSIQKIDKEGEKAHIICSEIDGIKFNDYCAIYGEWCGGNIQKGVAINGLNKMFVIFVK